MILESLAGNGQFRPLVSASRRTGSWTSSPATTPCRPSAPRFRPLGPGHPRRRGGALVRPRHVRKRVPAAQVAVCQCDDATARRIVLADSRTSDAGGHDEGALATLLSGLDGEESPGPFPVGGLLVCAPTTVRAVFTCGGPGGGGCRRVPVSERVPLAPPPCALDAARHARGSAGAHGAPWSRGLTCGPLALDGQWGQGCAARGLGGRRGPAATIAVPAPSRARCPVGGQGGVGRCGLSVTEPCRRGHGAADAHRGSPARVVGGWWLARLCGLSPCQAMRRMLLP